MYYKVKFLGYDAEADWEPCHNISDELIKTYWAKKQVPKEPKPDKETRLKRKSDKTDILEKTKEKNTKKIKVKRIRQKTRHKLVMPTQKPIIQTGQELNCFLPFLIDPCIVV